MLNPEVHILGTEASMDHLNLAHSLASM